MRFLLLTAGCLQFAVFNAFGQQLYKEFLTPLEEINFDFGRWPYPLHQENADKMHELAEKYPRLTSLHNIGTTQQGRDMWLMEITNKDTGPGTGKPGLWLDGNMHAGEVNGRPTMMYMMQRLLDRYGKMIMSHVLLIRAHFILCQCSMPTAENEYSLVIRHGPNTIRNNKMEKIWMVTDLLRRCVKKTPKEDFMRVKLITV